MVASPFVISSPRFDPSSAARRPRSRRRGSAPGSSRRGQALWAAAGRPALPLRRSSGAWSGVGGRARPAPPRRSERSPAPRRRPCWIASIDLLVGGALDDVALGAGHDRVGHVLLLVGDGQDEDLRGRRDRSELPGRLDPRHPRHLQVHHDDVGLLLLASRSPSSPSAASPTTSIPWRRRRSRTARAASGGRPRCRRRLRRRISARSWRSRCGDIYRLVGRRRPQHKPCTGFG